MAAVLQETKIRVKRNEDCKIDVQRLVKFNSESMICGYEYKHDACQVSYNNISHMPQIVSYNPILG